MRCIIGGSGPYKEKSFRKAHHPIDCAVPSAIAQTNALEETVEENQEAQGDPSCSVPD